MGRAPVLPLGQVFRLSLNVTRQTLLNHHAVRERHRLQPLWFCGQCNFNWVGPPGFQRERAAHQGIEAAVAQDPEGCCPQHPELARAPEKPAGESFLAGHLSEAFARKTHRADSPRPAGDRRHNGTAEEPSKRLAFTPTTIGAIMSIMPARPIKISFAEKRDSSSGMRRASHGGTSPRPSSAAGPAAALAIARSRTVRHHRRGGWRRRAECFARSVWAWYCRTPRTRTRCRTAPATR